MARVCDVHEGILVTGGVGACHNCSSFIGNTSHELCEPCSERLKQCAMCREPVSEPEKTERLHYRQLVKKLKNWKYPRIWLPAIVDWSVSSSVRAYLTSEKLSWRSHSNPDDVEDYLVIDIAIADIALLVPINPRTTYFQTPDLLESQELSAKYQENSLNKE